MFDTRIETIIRKVDGLRHEVDDHWQIPADEARVLSQLVRMSGAKCICEVGTSYGFSTLHLAAAASENGGHVYTYDIDPKKHEASQGHLAEAGLADYVTFTLGDARTMLADVVPNWPYDFLFIDGVKEQSITYINAVLPRVAESCWIVTDNILTHPEALAPFREELRQLSDGKTCAIPVGNGIEVTHVGKKAQ